MHNHDLKSAVVASPCLVVALLLLSGCTNLDIKNDSRCDKGDTFVGLDGLTYREWVCFYPEDEI